MSLPERCADRRAEVLEINSLERIDPQGVDECIPFQRDILNLHLERYRFAAGFAQAKRVLDCACGLGYGSALLKEEGGASEVVGVDIDEETIQTARSRYARDGIIFRNAAYEEVLKTDRFDVVVSLETVEHVPDPEHFVRHMTDLLPPGGRFVGSVPITPSVDVNPYHLHDFTGRGFRELLEGVGLEVCEELLQVRRLKIMDVRALMAERSWWSDMRRSLFKFYLNHPGKAFLRAKSIFFNGACNKYAVICAMKRG